MHKATSRWLAAAMAAMFFASAAGCGGMEEDEALTLEEEEVGSAEEALLKVPPPSCPSGFTKVTNSACDPGDTPCFRCCGWVPAGSFYIYKCYDSPTCAWCPWNMCGCWHSSLARSLSCYTTTELYGWTFIYVWKCAMSNGTTCTYNYYTRALLYCS
jgi:hypothetical protein